MSENPAPETVETLAARAVQGLETLIVTMEAVAKLGAAERARFAALFEQSAEPLEPRMEALDGLLDA